MRNIIKSFLETHAKFNGEMHRIHELIVDFDDYYDEFIQKYPIGEAEQSLIQEIWNRASVGVKKYGVTTDRTDLTQEQWKQHLREELMDGLVYLTKITEI